MDKTVDFAGLQVDNVTMEEAVGQVKEFIKSGQPHLITTPNPEIIVTSQTDQELKEIINHSALRVPDGISMVVVSKILGHPLKERVSGIDLMLRLMALSGQEGYRVFLVGSAQGVAEQAATNLKNKYHTNIVGILDGFFGDDSSAVKKIKEAKPDLLLVGLGGGKQERWLNRHLKELGVPVAMTIGGSLDVISGLKKRAPQWTQTLYIEWLYRLVTEPRRWKRQLALPRFLWLVLGPKIR